MKHLTSRGFTQVDDDAINLDDKAMDNSDLDFTHDVQIFGRDGSRPRDLFIQRTQMKLIGKGGQAAVYELDLPGEGPIVNKYNMI